MFTAYSTLYQIYPGRYIIHVVFNQNQPHLTKDMSKKFCLLFTEILHSNSLRTQLSSFIKWSNDAIRVRWQTLLLLNYVSCDYKYSLGYENTL